MRRWLRLLGTTVTATFAVAYLAVGALLWALQERMIFPAPGGIGRDALDQAAAEFGAAPVDLVASDGTRLYAWHRTAGSTRDRLLLFLHGNGEVVTSYLPLYRLLQQDGWDVLALAYRGYPGSEGAPSEAGMALDAEAAWAWATDRYAPGRIVVHGRSLGGAVAASLVAGPANPSALVLESTFVSMRDLARRQAPLYPVDWLLRHPFDTRDRAPALGVPVLLMHSRDDQVIPADLGGRALRNVIAEVDYHEAAGFTHQDCLPMSDPELRRVYLAFLARAVPAHP